jgi:hypothetical protein
MIAKTYAQLFIYFCIFVIGIIIGRVAMAVQIEVMKPTPKKNVTEKHTDLNTSHK